MEITANLNQLNLLLSDFERYASTMEALSEQIASQDRSSPLLKTAFKKMQNSYEGIQQLKTVLGSAVMEYSNTENRLCAFSYKEQQKNAPSGGGYSGGGDGSWGSSESGNLFPWEKLIKKLVGSAGVVGQAAKFGISLADGDGWDISKDVTKLVGGFAKLADTATVGWRDLLGFKSARPKTSSGAFKSQLEKYIVSKDQSAGKNVAAVTKWAGEIITVLETGTGNLDEFKDSGGWANPRMYAETAVESTLKIGSNIFIGAAVAVVAGTPVGWAAVGVGAATTAITVGANWALNGLSKAITGNDEGWVENLSDSIINTVGSGVKAVGDCVKQASKSVAKWWNGLWS